MPKFLTPGDKFELLGKRFTVVNLNTAKGDILCVADKWKEDTFDDATRRDCTNNFVESHICRELKFVFFASMIESTSDTEFFVSMTMDIADSFGNKDYGEMREYVRLLTQWEMFKYRKYLDIPTWAWTMTPYRCKTKEKQNGDRSVAIADSSGRYGNISATRTADVYPVVTFKQKVSLHDTFKLILER